MRRALLPLLAAATAACAGPPPGSPEAAVPAVAVPLLEERALLLYLADRRLYDGFTVQQVLAGGAELRRELAVALGRIGEPRSRRVLEGLLVDPLPEVRRQAAFALGVLGEPEAAPALLRAAAADDRQTAVLAVEALGKLGAPLVDVLEVLTPLPEEERWPRLLPHLWRFRSDSAVPLATRGMELDDPALRLRAAFALTREPRPAALPALRRLAGDAEPRIRAWAARALGLVGAAEDLHRLLPLLADPESGPVIQALGAGRRLVRGGAAAAPELWRPELLRLLDDPRPGVRSAALAAAGAWLLDEELGERLVRRFTGGAPGERELALLSLAEGGHPRALGLAARAAGSNQVQLRARAAAALAALLARPPAGLPEETAAELLEGLAADPAPVVRRAALEARLEVRPGDTDVAAAGLEDPDPAVRGAAFDWLQEHPAVAVEALLASLRRPWNDRLLTTRLSAVAALAARAAAAPAEREAAVAALEELAGDLEYLVRRAAIRGLEELDRPAPALGAAPERRSVDVCRRIVRQTLRPRSVEVRTERGTVTVELACPRAPLTCLSFLQLASQGFYDGLPFHRVVPDFVAQAGDPRGDGWGGPGYTLPDEINRLRFERGVMGMAHAGADTAGSQFFLTLAPQPHLDGRYTAFGRVTAGLEVLDRIVQGDVILGIAEVP